MLAAPVITCGKSCNSSFVELSTLNFEFDCGLWYKKERDPFELKE